MGASLPFNKYVLHCDKLTQVASGVFSHIIRVLFWFAENRKLRTNQNPATGGSQKYVLKENQHSRVSAQKRLGDETSNMYSGPWFVPWNNDSKVHFRKTVTCWFFLLIKYVFSTTYRTVKQYSSSYSLLLPWGTVYVPLTHPGGGLQAPRWLLYIRTCPCVARPTKTSISSYL